MELNPGQAAAGFIDPVWCVRHAFCRQQNMQPSYKWNPRWPAAGCIGVDGNDEQHPANNGHCSALIHRFRPAGHGRDVAITLHIGLHLVPCMINSLTVAFVECLLVELIVEHHLFNRTAVCRAPGLFTLCMEVQLVSSESNPEISLISYWHYHERRCCGVTSTVLVKLSVILMQNLTIIWRHLV